MSQEQVGTRLPGDDARTLEQYCKEKDVSKAEALRRAVRGLDEGPNWAWRSTLVAGIVFLILAEAGLVTGTATVVLGAVLVVGLFLSYFR